jgi:hypothetical protein
MQAGARDSARTIAVLSDDYLRSVYGGAEWQAAWAQDPEGSHRKLLTVRVAEAQSPSVIGMLGAEFLTAGSAMSVLGCAGVRTGGLACSAGCLAGGVAETAQDWVVHALEDH